MFLTFFDTLREFIVNIFNSISFSSIITLITGIIIGFVLCAVIYMCVVLSAMKKEEKKNEVQTLEIEDEEILKIIRSAKNQYIEESNTLVIKDKIGLILQVSGRLIEDIAKKYYPNSTHPIYELNIDEILTLCHYITDRINSMFESPVMKLLKKVKISQVLKAIDLKKKVDENKVVKVANKTKIPKIISGVMTALNAVNPVFWVKKIMLNASGVIITRKLAMTAIEVIGDETNKIYSKNVFNRENNLNIDVQNSIDEIEKLVKGDN